MAAENPLNRLVLAAASVSDDLGFVALSDLSGVLAELTDIESRIIGGHMVTLHVQRWGLGRELYRETRDTDLGIPPVAELNESPIPNLAEALRRPGINVLLELQRLNGTVVSAEVMLPDEASALVLKALVWQRRGVDKDAVDLWRMLEVAAAAGVSPGSFSDAAGAKASEIAKRSFGKVDDGAMKSMTSAQHLSTQAAQRRHTRIQALIQRVLG